MKKHILVCCAIIVISLISIILVHNIFKTNKDIKISIKNNTSEEIRGLSINSNALNKDIKIPNILKKDEYKTKLITFKNFHEGKMVMYYFDKQGNKQQFYLLPYFENGYSGKINVTINSIDDNGVLSVNIEKS